MQSSYAADWPRWMGPMGANQAIEEHLPASFDTRTGENVTWAAELGAVAFGTPVVAGGRVYVGTNHRAVRGEARFKGMTGGVVVCLDEATGERLWTFVTPERTTGYPKNTHMVQQKWGICSSPTVDGDRLYVITNGNDLLCMDIHGLSDGNDGPFQEEAQFMAGAGTPPVPLQENDGDILWRYDIPRELDVAPHDVGSCSVLVHGDVVYTSTSNGIGTGSPVYALNQEAPAFIALDKHTGRYLARDKDLSQRLYHAQWSAPTLAMINNAPQILLGGGDGICYAYAAIDASQEEIPRSLIPHWQFDCNPPHYKHDQRGKEIYYYRGDLRVYKTKLRNKEDTTGFNFGDGSFIGPNDIIASPVVYEDHVYVITGRDPEHGLGQGTLQCIDATQTGEISEPVWRFEGIGRSMATPAIADGLLYAADLNGRLYCFDAKNGNIYWIHHTRHEIWGSPLVANGKIYLNTRNSFWILKAGKHRKVLFTTRGGSETPPIAANGVVYVFQNSSLFALASDAI